ncbi:MAG: FMN-binding protein [Firmicutes bacterium]|nr:FMN-binding protein [Bacillota bacterium]
MVKKLVIAVLVLILILGGAYALLYTFMSRELEKLGEIAKIDLSLIEDGVYEGYSRAGLVAAELRVVVKNHRIEQIEIIDHVYGTGKPAEAVLDAVVEKQSLQVDAVAGSTASSKNLLKAVENALLEQR